VIVLRVQDLFRSFREIRLSLKHADEWQITNDGLLTKFTSDEPQHGGHLLLRQAVHQMMKLLAHGAHAPSLSGRT
jgi:hypothetical protein